MISKSVQKRLDHKIERVDYFDKWRLSKMNESILLFDIFNAGADFELERCKEYIMDCLGQGCGTYDREKDIMIYDHMCLSTYEHGLQLALKMGWIEESQLSRPV